MVGVVELGLEHLQVAHLEAGGRKRHLKVHRDRRPGTRHYVFLFPFDVFKPGPLFLSLCFQELDFGRYLRFLHAPHPLDLPHDGVLARLVLGLALHADQLDTTCVEWGGDSRKERDQDKLPR